MDRSGSGAQNSAPLPFHERLAVTDGSVVITTITHAKLYSSDAEKCSYYCMGALIRPPIVVVTLSYQPVTYRGTPRARFN
jgi:hypothetical protein